MQCVKLLWAPNDLHGLVDSTPVSTQLTLRNGLAKSLYIERLGKISNEPLPQKRKPTGSKKDRCKYKTFQVNKEIYIRLDLFIARM